MTFLMQKGQFMATKIYKILQTHFIHKKNLQIK